MMPLCSSYKHGMFVVFAVLLHFNKQLLHRLLQTLKVYYIIIYYNGLILLLLFNLCYI